jgi:hypothetical protein
MSKKDITYQVEPLVGILEELKPILQAHWEEIALYKDKIPLDPDYDKYLELNESGAIRVVTARDGEKLIGYFISTIQPHLHYQQDIYAINDILYLDETYRGSDTALGLFMFAEEDLKALGVSVMIISMKVAKPFDALCEALGHTCVERTYSKYIKAEV